MKTRRQILVEIDAIERRYSGRVAPDFIIRKLDRLMCALSEAAK